jgi:hypothetical protein
MARPLIVAAEAGRQMPLTGLPVAEMIVTAKSAPAPEVVPGPMPAVVIPMGVVRKTVKMTAEEMAAVKSMIMEVMSGKGMAGKSVPKAAVRSAAAAARRCTDIAERETEQAN